VSKMIWKPEDLLVNYAQTCHRGKEAVIVAPKMENGIPGPNISLGLGIFFSLIGRTDIENVARCNPMIYVDVFNVISLTLLIV
jgi:hypothetical protein